MDFTNADLFKNLLETQDQSFHIDLHNDYTCISVSYSDNVLELKFENDKDQGYITVQFKDVLILKMQVPLQRLTLDNFHRGRYELNGQLYDEYNGRKCFYIEFYEGGTIELLCTQALVQIPSSKLN